MLCSLLTLLGSSLDSDRTSYVTEKLSSDILASIEQVDEPDTPRRSESSSPTWSLGDILQSLEEPQSSPEYMIEKANDLVTLLQRHSVLKYDLVMSKLTDRIRIFLLHPKSEVIAAGYRMARYAITDIDSIRSIRRLHIDIFVVRTLTKDFKCHIERTQSLKLVRALLDSPQGVEELSLGIIRALISVCEQSDDRLRNIAIETITEIFLQSPEKIHQANGVRVLLQCAVEGPYELSPSICMAFLYIMDHPKHNKSVRLGGYLVYLISPFTDLQTKGHVNTEKLQNCAKILAAILKTWPGLVTMCSDDFHPLKSLINCFKYPIPSLRENLMDIFFSIFRIKPLSWSSSFLAGRRLTTFGRIAEARTDFNYLDYVASSAQDSRFTTHYTAMLLAIAFHCGLMENLIHVIKEYSETANNRRATLLIGELLYLSSDLLPQGLLRKFISLPGLLDTTAGDDNITSAAVFQIDKISRTIYKARIAKDADDKASSVPMQVKVKMGVQIDDAGFRQLLLDTQVLTTKTFTRWNWDVLTELIQGPLTNPRRLEEAIKTTKFMKRLMSFYRPFKYRFSSIKKTRPNQKCVKVGKELFRTLLQTKEGIKYLNENKLLSQIAECLAQLDPMSGISSPDPLFSKQRLENTLSSGYFSLLGTLSADPNGMAMMENRNMFNMFYHLSDLRSRDDLICNFLASMDFELQGHPRIIMAKALTTGQKNVRLFATAHLKTLYNAAEATQKWAIVLLVTQLYDPEMEVCKLAVEVLEEYCKVAKNLEYFVLLQPSLDHLGEIGNPLLLKFLSTSKGFQYLKGLDYVHQEMDNWFHGQNDNYVLQIEEYLEKAHSPWPSLGREDPSVSNIPRHFYGELTLTDEGCQLLRAKGHFEMFCNYIQENKKLSCADDPDILVKLKGCLWAVGHAGSNSSGAPFLESTGVVSEIIGIAEKSPIATLKGTALLVAGLISSTPEGMELLDELGWESVCKSMDTPLGLCMPTNLAKFFDKTCDKEWGLSSNGGTLVDEDEDAENMVEEAFPYVIQSDTIRRNIISALTNLSNQILANDSSKSLVDLSRKHGDRFKSIDLFLETMGLLEKYKYKLPVRKFIFELFDSSHLLEKMAERQKEAQRKSRQSTGELRKSQQLQVQQKQQQQKEQQQQQVQQKQQKHQSNNHDQNVPVSPA